jgi:hypothetical protein
MPNYISSNNNRFYAGLETSYGVAADSTQVTRIPAVSLKTKHLRERLQRRDKTGTRTFLGLPSAGRYRTTFELQSYMAAWPDASHPPVHGALFTAALGSDGRQYVGGTLAGTSGTQVSFTSSHGLTLGQAISCGGEVRFVTGIVNSTTVQTNAPFTTGVTGGDAMRGTYSYLPGPDLKSATRMDFWSPQSAVHRLLSGAAVDQLEIDINGDFHEFRFSGSAADLIDNASFNSGQAGLTQFPQEPTTSGFDYSLIPGHLGQAWIGSIPGQFFTLASAHVTVSNNLLLRAREFGYLLPKAIAPGERDVRVNFSVYAQDDAQTQALYQAARQQSPMSVMFQLGQQDGQLCGLFLKSVMAEVPEFDDTETRLLWNFKSCRAQGIGDDEIAIAFA